MGKIREIHKELKRFNINKETAKNLKSNSELFINLLRDQLRSGEQEDGPTREYRSLWYAEEKRFAASYNAPYPRADYFDTGSFQNQMYIIIFGNSFKFYSKDSKASELEKFEGEEIFGLNPDSMEIARSVNQELLADKVKLIFRK